MVATGRTAAYDHSMYATLLACLASAVLVSSCSLPDGLKFRDNYMGRTVADRNIEVNPVPRDANGNPILPAN